MDNESDKDLINVFGSLKSNTPSGEYGMQFNAVIDALGLSARMQSRLKKSIDKLIEHSKVLVKLTRALIILTIILILVGVITIFFH